MNYNRRMEQVLNGLVEGLSLAAITQQSGAPRLKTVRDWLASDAEFRERYDAARSVWADRVLTEIQTIADEVPAGCSERDLRRAKMRIDARREALARFEGAGFRTEAEAAEFEAPLPPIDLEIV